MKEGLSFKNDIPKFLRNFIFNNLCVGGAEGGRKHIQIVFLVRRIFVKNKFYSVLGDFRSTWGKTKDIVQL